MGMRARSVRVISGGFVWLDNLRSDLFGKKIADFAESRKTKPNVLRATFVLGDTRQT